MIISIFYVINVHSFPLAVVIYFFYCHIWFRRALGYAGGISNSLQPIDAGEFSVFKDIYHLEVIYGFECTDST